MSAEFILAVGLIGCVAALAIPAYLERRNERRLRNARLDIRIARAAKLARRLGWLPDDVQ